jgi:glutathione S-transferase
MYKLYNVKTWGSLAIHCLLEELEAPYTNIWMTREQVRDPEFRAISPLGMIPALGLADGRALYESAAIVSFLVAAHPEKHMSPALGTADYGEFMTLLHLMSTEIYAFGNVGVSVDEYIAGAAERQAMKDKISQKVDGYWMIIEKRLAASGPWLMGREFSALDLYAFMLSIWGPPDERGLHHKYPAIAKLAAAVRARPKLKAVLESHGVMEPGGYLG